MSYFNIVLCAVNVKPWECVHERAGRVLDSLQETLVRKENDLKG